MFVKPHTIQKHVNNFTPKGLPLMVLVEENAPLKEGTPYLFKSMFSVEGQGVEKCTLKYTNDPDSLADQLHEKWSANGVIKIDKPSFHEISRGEAALIEMSREIRKKAS